MFDWLTDIVSGIGGNLSDLWGGVSGAAGQFAGGLGDLGGSMWSGIQQNPWQALGVGLQGAGTFAPMLLGQGGQQPQGMDVGAWSQMQQPGGPTPQQLRRDIGNVQSRGLSGASPDFMASMAGVTPEELNQMLGYRSGNVGAT